MSHHHHHHNHKREIFFYFVGLLSFIIGLFMRRHHSSLAPYCFILTTFSAGYHTVLIDGLQSSYIRSRRAGKIRLNAHVLNGLASIGALVINEHVEGALLMLIFSGAHFLEDYIEGRSNREIEQLLKLKPTTARRYNAAGEVEIVEVSELVIGDRLQVLKGDQIPIDGQLTHGFTVIDESAISGEGIPVEKKVGDTVFGGTMNEGETVEMTVTTEEADTVFAKIVSVVQQNSRYQTRPATFIQRHESPYVLGVIVFMLVIVFVDALWIGRTWEASWYRGLVLLVSASPCALAAATVSVTLSANSSLARIGVLSKGSVFLSEFSKIDAIAFDKTGTITQGHPEVVAYEFVDGVDEGPYVDYIVALEKSANHPLADAILRYFKDRDEVDLTVENQTGKGLIGYSDQATYQIGKADLFDNIPAGLMAGAKTYLQEGATVVYFAEDQRVLAYIALMDQPKEEAKDSLAFFKKQGIHTTLLTGDGELTAESIGKKVGLDDYRANVLPEDKAIRIQEKQADYGRVAMVGDGINDAPALSVSDVGIAMGSGTDIAVEVADLVLMSGDLDALPTTYKIARKMEKVIKQNILFAMLVVLYLVSAAFLEINNMTLSVIFHEGSTILVILNGLRLLNIPK